MQYTRDPKAVRQNFEVNKAKQVICKNPCYIQIPVSYVNDKLATLGADIQIYGLFAVILETGQMSVVNTTAMFSIAPSATNVKIVDGNEYYEFFFAKDSVVFKTTGLLSNSKLIFNPFNTFLFSGRVPWFVGYDDHGRIFDTAPKFAGFGSLKNPEVMEFLTAACARKMDDQSNEFLRVVISDYKDGEPGNVDFVGLSSVTHTVKSSLNKITGAYGQDGIISAIVSPYDKVGTVEKIVRA